MAEIENNDTGAEGRPGKREQQPKSGPQVSWSYHLLTTRLLLNASYIFMERSKSTLQTYARHLGILLLAIFLFHYVVLHYQSYYHCTSELYVECRLWKEAHQFTISINLWFLSCLTQWFVAFVSTLQAVTIGAHISLSTVLIPALQREENPELKITLEEGSWLGNQSFATHSIRDIIPIF